MVAPKLHVWRLIPLTVMVVLGAVTWSQLRFVGLALGAVGASIGMYLAWRTRQNARPPRHLSQQN
jgi:hypothetical protein